MRYLDSSTSFRSARSRRTANAQHGSTALITHTTPPSTPSRSATERASASLLADGSCTYSTGRPAATAARSDASLTCPVTRCM